ncbi:MAG: hypothetical protein WCI74_19260 [Actinomycetes bacterium]
MTWRSFVAGLAVFGLLLAGCSSSVAAKPEPSATAGVSFVGCDAAACIGTIEGAPYQIAMPPVWNGTLLLYSHGYEQPKGAGPGTAPSWDNTSRQVAQPLLDQGYAIAGSGYKSTGWAVADGVQAAEQLYDYFATAVAKPQRVYAWGDSLGGLITQTLSEKHPQWLSGAAPLCGVLAGVVPNMNLALDVSYAVKTLIYPSLKLTGFRSVDEASAQLKAATDAIVSTGLSGDTAKIAYIAAIADGPPKTASQAGDTLLSKTMAYGEGIITALNFSTIGRFDIERRYGGNISGNLRTNYASRVTAADAAAIAAQGGSVANYNAKLAAGTRVAADPAAVAKAVATGGDPTGDVTVPTITLHTEFDSVAIVQNESYFRDRYQRKPRTGGLVQFYTSPPPNYPPTGAPYGAGHCNFTIGTRVGMIGLLDQWVKSGKPPTATAAATAFGPDSGLNPGFKPTDWPAQN